MKIAFFGTPPFAAQVLTDLFQAGFDVVTVISKPDRPKGRSSSPVPTPVKLAAHAFDSSIPVYQPELVSAPEFSDTLKSFKADLFIVVAYGELIKQHLLDMPPLGCINLHASLLPKYRGAAPIQRSIIDGEAETGVTIMYMVKKMDAGDIIEKVKVPIGADTTFGELERLLCISGSQILIATLHNLEKEMIQRIPQDHTQATFAPKIELEDCEIDWNLSAKAIHNLVRGVNPYPGAWCYITINGAKRRLKVNRTKLIDRNGKVGEILKFEREGLIVHCGDQALQILELQLEGKKVMSAEEFIRGMSKEKLSFY